MASDKPKGSRGGKKPDKRRDQRFAAEGRTPQAEHILSATYSVLAREGFAGLSMSRIANEAGVNKRMLHYYFDTKERLIEEMAKSLLEMVVTQLKEATRGFTENPGMVFTVGLDRTWAVVTGNRELIAAYISISSQAVFDERLAQTLYRNKQAVRDMMISDLNTLVATGQWRLKVPPEAIAEMTVAMFQGFVLEWVERGDDAHLLQALATARRSILALGEPVG